jgi:predicted small integral membrane protein
MAASLKDQHWWRVLGGLPFAAAVLVAGNALYMLLVAFGNITDYRTDFAFVQHVLSMDTTNFGATPGTGLDPDVMWRSLSDHTVWNVAYVAVIVWESLVAVVLLAACAAWIRALVKQGTFDRARALSSIGLLMIIALFFGGFIGVGGEWFQMWRSTTWNGLDPAFRNSLLAGVTLVLIHLPTSAWGQSPPPVLSLDQPGDLEHRQRTENGGGG